MEANLQSLELLPMDDAPVAAPAPAEPETIEIESLDKRKVTALRPVAPDAGGHTPVDPFAREAARQYAEGHIDQALWDRAIAQATGDRDKAAVIYLAARAVSLRMQDRERRQRAREPIESPTVNGSTAANESLASANEFMPLDIRAARSKYRNYAIAGVVALLLAAGGWVALNHDDGSANSLATAQAVNTSAAVEAAAAEKAKALAAEAQAAAVTAKVIPDLVKKIDDLRASGNWNLAVIYLADLTRKDPNNAAYWDELRDGYVHLNQFDDARDAAVKAAERAPSNPRMWRNLGDIYATQKNSADALAAYNKVVAFDPQDVDSWRQIGLLNARLGHLADAKAAIDHVLAVNPIDSTALCVKPALAQIPADGKDTRAVFMGVEAMEAKCQGASVPVLSAAVK